MTRALKIHEFFVLTVLVFSQNILIYNYFCSTVIVPLCWCSEDWRRVAIPIAAYTKPGIMKWKEEDFLKHPAIPNPETFYELDIHFFVNGVICKCVIN